MSRFALLLLFIRASRRVAVDTLWSPDSSRDKCIYLYAYCCRFSNSENLHLIESCIAARALPSTPQADVRPSPKAFSLNTGAHQPHLKDAIPYLTLYCVTLRLKLERGLLWRVQKAYSSTEIPARSSTQISHECADLCMHIITTPHFNCYEHDLQMATTLVLQVLSIR